MRVKIFMTGVWTEIFWTAASDYLITVFFFCLEHHFCLQLIKLKKLQEIFECWSCNYLKHFLFMKLYRDSWDIFTASFNLFYTIFSDVLTTSSRRRWNIAILTISPTSTGRFETQVLGAQLPGFRCQVLRFQVWGTRLQESAGAQAPGVRCQIPGARFQLPGTRWPPTMCQVPWTRCHVKMLKTFASKIFYVLTVITYFMPQWKLQTSKHIFSPS